VEIAIINENLVTRYKLLKSCFIYTAEAIAILKTVEHIYDIGDNLENNDILTNSLSSLESIESTNNTTDITKQIQ